MSEQAELLDRFEAQLRYAYEHGNGHGGHLANAYATRDKLKTELRRLHEVNAELLEALQALVQRCEFDGIPNDSLPAVETARAAVARALGQ